MSDRLTNICKFKNHDCETSVSIKFSKIYIWWGRECMLSWCDVTMLSYFILHIEIDYTVSFSSRICRALWCMVYSSRNQLNWMDSISAENITSGKYGELFCSKRMNVSRNCEKIALVTRSPSRDAVSVIYCNATFGRPYCFARDKCEFSPRHHEMTSIWWRYRGGNILYLMRVLGISVSGIFYTRKQRSSDVSFAVRVCAFDIGSSSRIEKNTPHRNSKNQMRVPNTGYLHVTRVTYSL